MAEKRRYTVSLPDHVADAVEAHAKPLGSTPTEYAGDIVRWWFGQGCPPVTPDEVELRKSNLAAAFKERVIPVPKDLNVWALDPAILYAITDGKTVQKMLDQLGLPNLFAQASEHDKIRFLIAFDNHPTHWLMLDYYKGSRSKDGDGLSFRATPKADLSREQMLQKLQQETKKMGAKGPFSFSQIPILEVSKAGNLTPTS